MDFKGKKVVVTGASGYIAGWLVKYLLVNGAEVHATVRNIQNEAKLAHLKRMAEETNGVLRFFESDLLKEGSFDEAMKDCDIVMHSASPFFMDTKNPKTDLLDPALRGTQNVLNAVNKNTSVKRVVLTSSVNAIYGDNIDAAAVENNTLDEKYWNESSTLKQNPYGLSKVSAERLAWEMAEAQDRWSLVVINPSFVLGPATNPYSNFQSKSVMQQLGDGSFKVGVPNINFGMVDVRDVAMAHLKAALKDDAEGRYIVSAEASDFLKIGEVLNKRFGNSYGFPKRNLPKFLIWLVAPAVGIPRNYISRNVNHPIYFDNKKGLNELDLTYRNTDDTVIEFFEQLLQAEQIKGVN